jgi:hypothetical protein
MDGAQLGVSLPDSTRKDARGSCRTRAIFLVPAGVIIAIL